MTVFHEAQLNRVEGREREEERERERDSVRRVGRGMWGEGEKVGVQEGVGLLTVKVWSLFP